MTKVKESSKVFATFTLSRIPKEVLQSLDESQHQAIFDAFCAQEASQQHPVDIRFRIPLYYRAYYFVLFAGRDRRRGRVELEKSRTALFSGSHEQEPVKLTNSASDIFAYYTLSRIPQQVRSTLSETQVRAIVDALRAQKRNQRHSIDMRLTIPLYFRAYYLVLFGGRDRRRTTLGFEAKRADEIPEEVKKTVSWTASATIFGSVTVLFFATAYLLRSFMGIDIFPFHLKDILPVDLYGYARELFKLDS